MKIPNCRELSKRLRSDGFRITYDSSAGGSRVVIWEKKLTGNRTLDLQLWDDGKHRVSHTISGCMNTVPTDFVTLEQMLVAILTESTRMDNDRCKS